jgi:hypothetical protein
MTEQQLQPAATDKPAGYGSQLPATRGPFIVPQTFAELVKYAELISTSDLVPKDFKGKPANVMLAMQWGIEIGMSPVQSLTSIAVINGRPGIFGDAAKALVEASPLCEFVKESFTRDSAGNITAAVCVSKRRNRPEQSTTTFTIADAKLAKLWGKEGPWTQYPSRMLQMRARSWSLRDNFADVLRGIGIVEELQDIPGEFARVETAPAKAIAAETITLPRSIEHVSTDVAGPQASGDGAPPEPEHGPAASTTQASEGNAEHHDDAPFADAKPAEQAEPERAAGRPLNDGQNRTLDATLQRHGLTRIDARTKFGEITSANINDVLRWAPVRAAELAGDAE